MGIVRICRLADEERGGVPASASYPLAALYPACIRIQPSAVCRQADAALYRLVGPQRRSSDCGDLERWPAALQSCRRIAAYVPLARDPGMLSRRCVACQQFLRWALPRPGIGGLAGASVFSDPAYPRKDKTPGRTGGLAPAPLSFPVDPSSQVRNGAQMIPARRRSVKRRAVKARTSLLS